MIYLKFKTIKMKEQQSVISALRKQLRSIETSHKRELTKKVSEAEDKHRKALDRLSICQDKNTELKSLLEFEQEQVKILKESVKSYKKRVDRMMKTENKNRALEGRLTRLTEKLKSK